MSGAQARQGSMLSSKDLVLFSKGQQPRRSSAFILLASSVCNWLQPAPEQAQEAGGSTDTSALNVPMRAGGIRRGHMHKKAGQLNLLSHNIST
eukprot:scaffold279876_cov24-Tisochrysis_lutea.AAC.1